MRWKKKMNTYGSDLEKKIKILVKLMKLKEFLLNWSVSPLPSRIYEIRQEMMKAKTSKKKKKKTSLLIFRVILSSCLLLGKHVSIFFSSP